MKIITLLIFIIFINLIGFSDLVKDLFYVSIILFMLIDEVLMSSRLYKEIFTKD